MTVQTFLIFSAMAAQTSDVFSLFIIALAIAAAAWVIIFKKPPRSGQ